MSVTLESIQAAAERIGGAIYHSPCPYSLSLSQLCGCDIYCKFDHLQLTGSFKERGARNKLMLLGEEQKSRGVITASAGNHGLGVAYHGQQMGIPVTVVMPRWAPLVKVASCKSFGANVLLEGETYDQAREIALTMAADRGQTFIHGFDDADIIAGQGTLGLEILEDVKDADAVIVPVGGGGLVAGVGLAIKSIRPDVCLIAAESKSAPTLHESLRQGRPVRIETEPTLADGLAVAQVGTLCFEIAKNVVDDVILVDEAQIANSVLRLLELEKTVVEGAGAVPLAAVRNPSLNLAGKKVVLILSGGNIDVTMIARVIERGLATDGRLCRFVVQISDRPGSLAQLTSILARTGASVKEIYHDRSFGPADVARVSVVCVLETRDADHIRQIENTLRQEGIATSDR